MRKTLHITNTPELKIAKNFLILGMLVNALTIALMAFPIAGFVLFILSFVFTTGGFYKLSKIARNKLLFKYYMLLTISQALTGIVLSIMGIRSSEHLMENTLLLGSFIAVMLLFGVFYFYCFYKIALELTSISGIKLFVLGFKGIVIGIVIFLVGCLLLSLSHQLFYFISLCSLFVMCVGAIFFAAGIFTLKQVSYYE